jgi:hypothetical protein
MLAGDEGWVVMTDPGGNLFCVLQSLEDHQASGHRSGNPDADRLSVPGVLGSESLQFKRMPGGLAHCLICRAHQE